MSLESLFHCTECLSASVVRTNLQLVRIQLVTVPFDGSAGSMLAVLALLLQCFSAGRTAWLHGERDQENYLDFFFLFCQLIFIS